MSERRLDSERESLREASDDGSVRGGATAEDAEGRGGRGGEQGAIGGIGRREALKVLATSAVALPLAGSLAAC
ncbi:MAG: hypothetical protein KBF56_09665 [Gemmatimonadaceae bacterium]|nr:hypothetical protein [Gemmatimonadaceae bacterium]